jgi:hypothetical protein
MGTRVFGVAIAAALLVPIAGVGQAPAAAPAATPSARVTDVRTTYEGPRTPWGHPDLQGTWDYRSITRRDLVLTDGKRLFLGSSGTAAPSDGPDPAEK